MVSIAMKKRLFIALCLLACFTFILVGSLWAMWSPRHRINEESYQRLRRGMSRNEIIEIFGVPPGDYGPGKVAEYEFTDLLGDALIFKFSSKWAADKVEIYVQFD